MVAYYDKWNIIEKAWSDVIVMLCHEFVIVFTDFNMYVSNPLSTEYIS